MERYGPRRPDRIVHLDGVRPGTLGWRCVGRGCASEAGKLQSKELGSQLSLKGWTRSRREEGLELETDSPNCDSLGGAEGGTGVALAGGGAEKGRERGPEGAGVGAGGVRRAGGPDVWGVPLQVCSPSLLASVWPRRAEREGIGAPGNCPIHTCGNLAPRTWCGWVAVLRCPPGYGASEDSVYRPQGQPVSRRAEDRVGALPRALCLSGWRRGRLGAWWPWRCCCTPPCLQPPSRYPRARCSRACE